MATICKSVRLGKNVEIADSVVIGDGAMIGDGVELRDGVSIGKNAIIGNNSIIGYIDLKPGQRSAPPPATTEIGENSRVRSGCVIYWGCRIGTNSMVGHNSVFREKTIVGHDTYVGTLVSVEGDTVIGNYVGIQTQCYITKFCTVGDYTFIAPAFSGANDYVMSHRRAQHGHNLKGFTTERYVRIGISAISLPGVTFGEGCIVGAGSVVTKDVPPYKVVMGVPARVVRDAPHEPVVEEGI